jgi:hypothetical protein
MRETQDSGRWYWSPGGRSLVVAESDQVGAVAPQGVHELVAAGHLRGVGPGEVVVAQRRIDPPRRRACGAQSQLGQGAAGRRAAVGAGHQRRSQHPPQGMHHQGLVAQQAGAGRAPRIVGDHGQLACVGLGVGGQRPGGEHRTEVVDALAKRLRVARSPSDALTQAEAAADRFLAERAVRVAHDRRLGVERFSTPELLALERQLVDAATKRTEQGCAVVRPELVRQVLDRHTTVGEDQAAMVRDLTQGGAGVAVVVGRAGSGKTWTLGVAREAFELAGCQVHGTAPTGIATVGLADDGFTDARTVDRLLLDLGRGREQLGERMVLVVDEAAMVATRKLAPLLQHAERTGAKVVLVGDDRQFAPIQAGGGFRALRLRLGASEVTINRRQVEAWEQRHRRHPRRQAGAGDRRLRRARPHPSVRGQRRPRPGARLGLVAGASGRGAAGDLRPPPRPGRPAQPGVPAAPGGARPARPRAAGRRRSILCGRGPGGAGRQRPRPP